MTTKTKAKKRKEPVQQKPQSDVERAAELRDFFENNVPPGADIQILGPFDVAELLGPKQHKRKVKPSRIRAELNRPFTDAHIEDFMRHPMIHFKVSVRRGDPKHIYAEGPMDSRKLSEVIEEVLANSYANYFVRHWRTFSEYSDQQRSQ